MPKGIMIVQSRPNSDADVAAFHQWYDEVHIPEILGIDGFTSARRLQSTGDGAFLAVYELDDVETAQAAMRNAQASGAMTRPTGVQLDPPPSVQWFTDLSTSPV